MTVPLRIGGPIYGNAIATMMRIGILVEVSEWFKMKKACVSIKEIINTIRE